MTAGPLSEIYISIHLLYPWQNLISLKKSWPKISDFPLILGSLMT